MPTTVPRNRYNASMSADYQFSEKTAAVASYVFGSDKYESTKYSDDLSHDVSAGLVYDLGQYFQRVKGRVNLGYSDYVFSDSNVESVMGTVGFSRDFSEREYHGGCRYPPYKFGIFHIPALASIPPIYLRNSKGEAE